MKFIKYIVLSMGLLFMASCSDFFDTKSPSAMDVTVFKSSVQTEQAIAGIYDVFGSDKSFRNRLCGGYVDMNTDIEYCNKSNGAAVYANYSLTATGASEVNSADGKDAWGYLNAAIERANICIDGIEKYSDLTRPQFQYYLGEVLTLRAFLYLQMVKMWGDVPANFKPFDPNDLNSIYSPKVDRNIIFEQLRTDLKRSVELMPWSAECPGGAQNFTGRPSKAFAYGLLARVDLMYAGKALRPDSWVAGGGATYSVQYNVKDQAYRTQLYQEALEACANVIKKEDSKLQTSYKQVFVNICSDVVAYNQSESLWEIPFANGTRGQVLNLCGAKNNAGTLLKHDSGSSHNSMIALVPTFIYDFEAGDTRKDVTVCPFSWEKFNTTGSSPDNPTTDVPGYTVANGELWAKSSKISQVYLGKYRTEWMVRPTVSSGATDDGVNLCIMRYADVLLMFAEASIGGIDGVAPVNNTGLDGLTQLNKVRARAFGNTSHNLSTYTINDIIKERAFEFCGEGIRKYDLMRWGIFGSKINETVTRIAALRDMTGEFATRNDKVYFKYTENDALATSGKAYEITSTYGLNLSETGTPPGYVSSTDNGGWIGKDFFTSSSTGPYLAADKFYLVASTVANVEYRQYWPIFNSNIQSSNGSLWNDYGY